MFSENIGDGNARRKMMVLSVLMVVQRYFPAIGGVEKHVNSITKQLRRKGVRSDILTSSHQQGLPSVEKSEEMTVRRIPHGYDKCPPLVYIWLILNRHSFKHYDLIHIHDPYPLIAWYLPLRILNLLTPTHITFHGYEADPVPLSMRVLRKVAKSLVSSTLCIGSFISRVYDISCSSSVLGAVKQNCQSSARRAGAIYVGRLEEDTGVVDYIESMGKLSPSVRIPLIICGGGSLQHDLRNLAHSTKREIDIKGYVDDPRELMAHSKVMLAGGFLSILEGMACGLPVIAYARTHLKWQYYKSVLDEGGPISIQTTPSGVASEIRRLLSNDDLWLKISEEGKRFAAQWTWDRMTDLYLRNWGLS